MNRWLALILIFIPMPVAAAEQQKTVPVQFQGEWNSNLKQCGTNLNDSRLMISVDRIQFYESNGPIKAVVTQGKFELALISELFGEGGTWLSFRQYRLSADRGKLTDVTNDESKFVRYRCPKFSK
ncbi:hypothetical protein APA_1341 [Pseudanabaena sp. lw0831]|uniref:hypothetical protein n=1 Tax=Pseudanabaena sp. lw0831 TaxID=1357935 RepID=UPI001914DAA8|nr:hypothetical protein [Pseudanabaena sp. lw0831]GBO53434.1 hypothetical protein APA_1341 [Pseudanabaena sp. lw0831]